MVHTIKMSYYFNQNILTLGCMFLLVTGNVQSNNSGWNAGWQSAAIVQVAPIAGVAPLAPQVEITSTAGIAPVAPLSEPPNSSPNPPNAPPQPSPEDAPKPPNVPQPGWAPSAPPPPQHEFGWGSGW